LLGQQHVVGADGAAGIDRLDDHLPLAQGLAQFAGNGGDVWADADQQHVDIVGHRENRRQRFGRDIAYGRDVPGEHARRQAEQRASMRDSRKAESSIAIGIDTNLSGIMRRVGQTSLRRQTEAPSAALVTGLSSSVFDLRPKLMRMGPLTMIDEYMPTRHPKVMAMVKLRMTSPPNRTSGISASNTVNCVSDVRT